MPLPLVAVVGRPNVGKSTFVNRIAQADEAIVHEMRGVTRDRSYHEADWNGVEFKLVDTGGIEMGDDDAFQGSIRAQAIAGANEADVVIFIVDGKTGINADDEAVARILRKAGKPVFLVVNKMDTPNRTDELWEFYQLGVGDPWPVSSTHGHGTGDLLDAVVEELRRAEVPADEEEEPSINVAIIGRPNAGKSSLTNKMTKGDRSIVSDVAGTTRDAIDTAVEHDGTALHHRGHGGPAPQEPDRPGRGVLRLRARHARHRPRRRGAARHRLHARPDRPGPARGGLRGRARLRHGHRAEQMGPRGRTRGQGRHTRAHRRPHDVRGLCAGRGHLGPHRQEGRPHLGGHRRGVRELQPDHPHEQAEHVALRHPRGRAHGEQRQGRSAYEVRDADGHVPAVLHVLREPARPGARTTTSAFWRTACARASTSWARR